MLKGNYSEKFKKRRQKWKLKKINGRPYRKACDPIDAIKNANP